MNKESVSRSNVVMGLHSVEAILKYAPERILKVFYLKQNPKTKDRKAKVLFQLKQSGKKLYLTSKENLEKLCQSTSHQGIALELKPRPSLDLDNYIQTNTNKLTVVLDSITDPHNLGAILRVCECFDVGLVLWSKNRGAQITPVVSKTSASATELVPIKVVSNIATTLDKFIKNDYQILGVHVTKTSHNIFNYSFPSKSVLILGSEGEGIRPILQKKLDASLMIPMHGKIDSLNVSQAAAISIGLWKNCN